MNDLLKLLCDSDLIQNVQNLIKDENCTKLGTNKYKWNLNNSELIIGKNPDGTLYMNYEVKNNEIINKINTFEKYIHSLDDDIFSETCEQFITLYGEHSLNDMNSYMDKKDPKAIECINKFMNIVSNIINKKLEYFKSLKNGLPKNI